MNYNAALKVRVGQGQNSRDAGQLRGHQFPEKGHFSRSCGCAIIKRGRNSVSQCDRILTPAPLSALFRGEHRQIKSEVVFVYQINNYEIIDYCNKILKRNKNSKFDFISKELIDTKNNTASSLKTPKTLFLIILYAYSNLYVHKHK